MPPPPYEPQEGVKGKEMTLQFRTPYLHPELKLNRSHMIFYRCV